MKQIYIRRIEIKNFKATNSRTIESIPDGGFIVMGHNGCGKSSLLDAICFALGGNCDASKVINQATKAAASVSLTVETDGKIETYTRVLTPTLGASGNGKITASTSAYTIQENPTKAGEYATRVTQLFGTRDWMYLLRPELNASNKDSRSILLAVAGAPSEKEFLQKSNQTLAETIGGTSFGDFEAREKQAVQALGKKIDAIPGRIEENAAMLQTVEAEDIDEAAIKQRLTEIREVLKGVDAENASRADAYNIKLNDARELQYQAAKLRAEAAEKVLEANREANKQVVEAEQLVFEWQRTRANLSRQMDQIKSETREARHEQADKERQLAESIANIQTIANECREISSRTPSADGNCTLCGKWCADLQAKGIEAAINANAQALDRTKQKGRNAVAERDRIREEINKINAKIGSIMSREHEIESKYNALGPAPTAPERVVITETPESLELINKAEDMEAKASAIIQGNRLEVAQKPAELIEEMTRLNEQLTRKGIATTTQKNNDKINARIEELRNEEKQLRLTQLKHKQNLVHLADFYRNYANSVTEIVNDLFAGTSCKVKLFDENMKDSKGVPVMMPMIGDSLNLSTAENLIFWKFFVERVMSKHYEVVAPMLIDNAEGIDSIEKIRSEHQFFATRVERHELTIENI